MEAFMEKPLAQLEEHINHKRIDFPINIYYTHFGKIIKDLYLHWHKEFEITYVISGEGIFYTDLRPIYVKKGDIMIIPPLSLHSGKPLKDFCECKTLVFSLDFLKRSSADSISMKYINPVNEGQYKFPLLIDKKNDIYKSILESFKTITATYEKQDFAFELLIKSELIKMIYNMFNSKLVELNISENDLEKKSEKIKSIITYVKKHYKSNITITEVANYLDYSENYFCRFFKNQTGLTFVEYLNSVRLNSAANLLHNSDKAITDIALECGFDNLSYFIRIFKKKFIVTPLKYRQYIRNNS